MEGNRRRCVSLCVSWRSKQQKQTERRKRRRERKNRCLSSSPHPEGSYVCIPSILEPVGRGGVLQDWKEVTKKSGVTDEKKENKGWMDEVRNEGKVE